MKRKIVFFVIGLIFIGCKAKIETESKDRYAYYTPSGHILEECTNEIPKVGDILPSYYNGVVIEVNIHGKRKGSITNYGIPYAPQTVYAGSEDLTYIYYDYVVKTDKQSPEYEKLYEEFLGKPLTKQ